MERFRYYLAILIGKLISLSLRLLQLGGTAAPGLYASKIDKNLIRKLSRQLKYSVIISGTNGKTTTTRILATIFSQAGWEYFHNRTGSNLLRGVISELIKHIGYNGLPKNRIGLWEIDEAVLPLAIKSLRPKIVVLTNLFRDQLDRYGEIDVLAKKWKQALKQLSKETIVILNADDPTVASLGQNLRCKTLYFGLKDKLKGDKFLSHASDATMCPYCLLPLNYQVCFVSHLGLYKCPKCGDIQPKTNINCTQVKFLKENYTQLDINYLSNKYFIKINLPGIYNVYNALAAFAVSVSLKINPEKIIRGFQQFRPAFGRFEKIKLKEKMLQILLVKNPTGFNQVLKILPHLSGGNSFSCLIALNDLIADGQDVSWIWDVDFENFKKYKKLQKIIVSGIRAEDMTLRLKYSNFKSQIANKFQSNIKLEKNLKKAISNLINQSNKNLFILPTYTAMLEIRKILNKMKLVHSTWKD